MNFSSLCLFLIVLLFVVGLFHSQASAQSNLETNRQTDTLEIRRLLDQSATLIREKLVERKNLDSALYLARRAFQLSDRLDFVKGKNDALHVEAMVYIRMMKDKELKDLLKKVEEEQRVNIILDWLRYKMIFVTLRSKVEADTFLIYARQALEYAESIHSPRLTSLSLIQLSSIYYELHDIVKGKEFFLKAMAAQTGEKSNYCQAYIFSQAASYIITDETLLPEFLKMREHLIKAYSYAIGTASSAKLQEQIIMGSAHITFYFIDRGNFSEALFYSLEMVKLLEKENNPLNEEMPYLTTAKIYLELDKLEECIDFCKRAASIMKKKGAVVQPIIIKTAASAYIALKRPQEGIDFIKENTTPDNFTLNPITSESMGNCYLAMKQYKNAENYYMASLKIHEKDPRVGILVLYVGLAKLYTETHQYDKARFYLTGLISRSNKSYVPLAVQRDAHLMMFKVDSAKKNYLSSIQHFHRYKSINDSIFSEKQSRQIEEMKTRFQTEKKDQEFRLLTRHSELNELELQQAQLIRNGLIVGAILLTVMLVLLYGRYRFRKRTNELLQIQQESINKSNRQLIGLNEELQKMVEEKEWLVKEIHHRVKNNLQVMVSLLNIQAAHLSAGEALDVIRDSQLQIQVISLLHQKLYQVGNSNIADMKEYIPELLVYIKQSYKGINHIYFDLSIDPIHLNIAQAVSLGLILNEAVVNAIKHGFKDVERGIIMISFIKRRDHDLMLTIKDNGSGLPEHLDPVQNYSLGMQLMRTLAEQLGGSMSIESESGVTVRIEFTQEQ